MHDEKTKATYAHTNDRMNKAVLACVQSHTHCHGDGVLSVMVMLIGVVTAVVTTVVTTVVTIARTRPNEESVAILLQTYRQEAGLKLDGI